MDGRKDREPEKSLTLQYFLENPALLQPPENDVEEKCKEEKEKAFAQNKQNDLTSAYLGPQIWSDMLLSDDLKLEPVDLDELLDPSAPDDEMSDLNLLMTSSPSKSVNRNEVQQCPNGDPSLMTYQDMPQLMTAHAPMEAKKVPSPIDYFCMQHTPKPACQQEQMPTCSSYQLHPSIQPQMIENQAIPSSYKVMEQTQLDQRHFSPFSDVFDNSPGNSNSQQMVHPFSLYMGPQRVNPIKRPRHSSVSGPLQVGPSSQNHPAYPPILPRQLSTNELVYNPRPPAMNAAMSPPMGMVPSQNSPPKTVASPNTPPKVHIPSPKTVNYVPNSADIIISTPQDACDDSPFDPSKRAFTEEELKPQPIIRKSKKVHVPADNKDGKYWSRRNKNNVAAKRSREARRIKENQIAMRASYLERENAALKTEVSELRKELTRAVDLVKKYEKRFSRNPN